MSDSLQSMYSRSSDNVRSSFKNDPAGALRHYSNLLTFVSGIRAPAPPAGTVSLLDVGCGTGWSTFAFASAGYRAVGIDLNPEAFEPPPHELCSLKAGSATDIPFEAESFDLVACYQCLEHVPAPERALDEMIRVCRPGGVVAVVGPNLVSPAVGLAYAVRPGHWKEYSFLRREGLARHPYGNTWPELFGFAALRSIQLVGKLLRRSPGFTMRQPDLTPPFHADNDAVYLCNPVDLIKHFKRRGLRIERRGKPGRLPLAHLVAGGTWVAARKPESKAV